jgi:hypothetical protein
VEVTTNFLFMLYWETALKDTFFGLGERELWEILNSLMHERD